MSPDFFAYTWLYVVGTLGFSELAYERIRDAYDMNERAKVLVANCIRYAQFYNRDMDLWKEFNKNKYIDISAFSSLLECSDVLLSDSEMDQLIQDISVNGDRVVTKEELESYLELEKSGRRTTILRNCFHNFSFVANSSWFIAAIANATAYHSSGNTRDVGYTVS